MPVRELDYLPPPHGSLRQEDFHHFPQGDPAHPLHEQQGASDRANGPVFPRYEIYGILLPAASIPANSAAAVSRKPSAGKSFILPSSSRRGRERIVSMEIPLPIRSRQREWYARIALSMEYAFPGGQEAS